MPKAIPLLPLTNEQRALVEKFRYLARYCTKHFRGISGRFRDIDLAERHAMMGIIKAASRFDPSCGVKFITYATVCAKNEMLTGLRDKMIDASRWKQLSTTDVDKEAACRLRTIYMHQQPVGHEVEHRDSIRGALQKLTDIERRAVVAYAEFGTLDGAGQHLGMTREAVRQSIARAQLKCSGKRHPLRLGYLAKRVRK